MAVAQGSPNAVSILLGDGAGNFLLASSPSTGVAPQSIGVGDFNRDGRLDLAVVNDGGTVSILLGDGTGDFTLASSPAVGNPVTSDHAHAVAVGDFNGDGNLDLAVTVICGTFPNPPGCFPGSVSILLGTAEATSVWDPLRSRVWSQVLIPSQSPWEISTETAAWI